MHHFSAIPLDVGLSRNWDFNILTGQAFWHAVCFGMPVNQNEKISMQVGTPAGGSGLRRRRTHA